MVDDRLGFKDDIVSFSMFPEMMNDFIKFNNKPIFVDIMDKLMVTNLPKDDFQYITDYAAYQRRLAVYNAKIEKEALAEANEKLRLKDIKIFQVEQYSKKVEQEKEKAEQEKEKAEQEKEKAEQEKEKSLITSTKKFLKRGDSFQDIMDFLEIDKQTFERFLKKINEEKANSVDTNEI